MGKTGIKSLDLRIQSASIAINNASDPVIAPLLSQFGYTASRLAEGHESLTALQRVIARQAKEYGEQYQATKEVNALWERGNEVYGTTLKIARLAFRDNPAAEQALGLRGRRCQSISGWVQEAQLFYGNVLHTFGEELARFGYTHAKLQEEAMLINELQQAVQRQNREIGEAQMATLERDAQMDETLAWFSDFYQVAKIALAGQPQLREKLGMLERN